MKSFHEECLRSAAFLVLRIVVIPGPFDLEVGSITLLYLSHTLCAVTETVTASYILPAIMCISNHYINGHDLVRLNVIKLLPYQ